MELLSRSEIKSDLAYLKGGYVDNYVKESDIKMNPFV